MTVYALLKKRMTPKRQFKAPAFKVDRAKSVECFLDQNPHRQKQTLLGKPILAPEALPETVRRLYVGLNPRVAREELAVMDWSQELEVFFP